MGGPTSRAETDSVNPRSLIAPDLPEWIAPPQELPAAGPAKAGEPKAAPAAAASRMLVWEEQIHVPRREEFHHYAARIETEAGLQQFGQINLGFAPSYEQLRWHYLRIWRAGEKREMLTGDALQVLRQEQDAERFMYHGRLTALVILHDLRVGDVVEYAFTRIGENPVFAGRFSDVLMGATSVPIDRLYYRVLAAPDHPLHRTAQGVFQPKFRQSESGGLVEYTWEARQLAAVRALNDAPGWMIQYPFVQLSEYATWAEVAAWGRTLFALPEEPSQEVRERVAALTASLPTRAAKAEALLRFVQDEVRYLGIELGQSSHRPSPPDEVLRRRYGDCKDKSLMLVAMLRCLGIKAHVALVQSDYRARVHDFQPSPYAFNHAIVYVPEAPFDAATSPRERREPSFALTSGIWLDPTANSQGGAFYRRAVGNFGYGLVLTDGTTDLLPMPVRAGSEGEAHVREVYTVKDYDAPAQLEVTTVYRGATADFYRYNRHQTDAQYFTQQLTGLLARFFPGVRNVRPIEWSDERETNTLTATATYEVPDFWRATGQFRTAELYPWGVSERLPRPETTERDVPFVLPYPQVAEHSIEVRLPSEWTIKPENTKIHDPTFDYTFAVRGEGRKIWLNYSWRTLAESVPPNRMVEWGRATGQVRNGLGYRLSRNLRLAAALGAARIVWPMVASLVGGLLAGVALGWVLLRWRSKGTAEPPELEASSFAGIGGWLVLLAIGVIVRPLLYVKALWPSIELSRNGAGWLRLTDPESASYMAGFAPIACAEAFVGCFFMGWSLVIVPQFFSRKSSLPVSLSSLMIVQVVWVIGYHFWYASLFPADTGDAGLIGGAVIAMLIWVPYLQKSLRVKRTFNR